MIFFIRLKNILSYPNDAINRHVALFLKMGGGGGKLIQKNLNKQNKKTPKEPPPPKRKKQLLKIIKILIRGRDSLLFLLRGKVTILANKIFFPFLMLMCNGSVRHFKLSSKFFFMKKSYVMSLFTFRMLGVNSSLRKMNVINAKNYIFML